MIIGYYNASVWLTFLGTALSIGGIMAAFKGDTKMAVAALMAAGIIDLFDGVVARQVKRSENEKAFGVQLDSLADMVAFVALPVSLYIHLGFTGVGGFVLLFIYALAAIQRLGFFNLAANNEIGTKSHYRGLPVTYAALILPWSWLLLRFFLPAYLMTGMALVLVLTAIFFILDIPVPKPRGIAYLIFVLLAVVTGIILFMI